MIKLLNTHTGEYLNLVEGTSISFEAENQMQNLEEYTVTFSFDIELVNDDNARDAVLYESYSTGKSVIWNIPLLHTKYKVDIMDRPKVILYKDGVPLFIGKLSFLGSTLTTIKCCLKCVPYGEAFKDFDMRSYIKDYARNTIVPYHQARSLIGPNFEVTSSIQNKETGLLETMIIHPRNYANGTPDFFANALVLDKEKGWDLSLDPYARFYWGEVSINAALRFMGIQTKAEDDDLAMVIPLRVQWKRQIKVRMYDWYHMDESVRRFHATALSEIWWKRDSDGEWELLESVTHSGTTSAAFASSIRKMKALPGMKLNRIEFPDDFGTQKGVLGLNTQKGYQSSDFGLSYGKEYKEGDTIKIQMNVLPKYKSPDYVDVIFDCDIDIDPYKLASNAIYRDVPMMPYDLAFFNTDTSKFLNELSLNHESFKWLRNPAFFNEYNYERIHNQKTNRFQIWTLSHNNIESVTKETSYDAPSELDIVIEMGYDTVVGKKLNNRGNDAKEIKHSFTGLGFVIEVDPNETQQAVPPIIFDNKNEEIISNDIQGVFGELIGYGRREFIHVQHSTDFDYMYNYSDESDKYTFNVVGYEFQELIDFEGQIFVVKKYRTSDFNKFELECYPRTRWVDEKSPDPILGRK